MDGKPSGRTGLLVGLGLVVSALVIGAALWRTPPGQAPASAEATGTSPVAPADEPVAATHPCTAEELARVAGVDVGATLAEAWRVDALACNDAEACTRIQLSHEEEALTLRICPHVDGAPLPPATHGGLDVFFDLPRMPVADTSIRAVVDAVAARLSAS